ncbi:VanZ family protein [Caldisalinibacter kiritimatiensis]|uniref:VanZ-like domain-containing protein n=1 Tax=Caldisalinibacter kiritimatiensis TaxID=1304284 RepID=R1ARA1_9FIRM|nr:VanZ family protein [Caldisalinibacter kiritimatiensis]EOC99687.1 hypothetical protein L21TH_2330 [Caldisalinibacter kiritimatiensis]
MLKSIYKKVIFVLLGLMLLVVGYIFSGIFNSKIGLLSIFVLAILLGTLVMYLTKNPINNLIMTLASTILFVFMAIYLVFFKHAYIFDRENLMIYLLTYVGLNIPVIVYKFLEPDTLNFNDYIKYLSYYFISSYFILLSYFLFFYYRVRIYTRGISLQPFKTITPYLTNAAYVNSRIAIINIFGNILLFIPIGFIVGIHIKNAYKSLIVLLSIPIIIEIVQYISATGISDIDDVILNFIGELIGLSTLLTIEWLYKKRHKNINELMFKI